MNSIAFFRAIIILCIIQLAFFVFIANLHSWLGEYTIGDISQLYSPTPVELLESAFLALLLIGVIGFVTFVKHLIFVQKISNAKGIFNKFYLPIIEELLKYGLVSFIAHRSTTSGPVLKTEERTPDDTSNSKYGFHLGVKQIAIIILIFNFIKFCLFINKFSPINYEKVYKEFISFYRMWREHITIDKTLCNNNKLKVDAAMILAGSLNDDKRSLYSKKSTATLINPPEAISIPSKVPPFGTCSLRIKQFPSFKSDIVSADLESCYKLVDKLYSISPKNTYHLDTNDIVVVSIDDLDDDEDPLKLLANYGDSTLNSIKTRCEQSKSQLLGDKEELNCNHISDLKFDKLRHVRSRPENEKYGTNPSIRAPLLLSCSNFFTWLLHFLSIPRKSEELNKNARRLTNNRKFDPVIQKKLSSYHLDNDSFNDTETLHSSDGLLTPYNIPVSNYGAIDLESQTSSDILISSISLNERNNRENFQLFVHNYFGYAYETNQFLIDPMFEAFGITVTEVSTTFFVALFCCTYVWNLSTFLIYAYPFLNDSFLHFYYMIIGVMVIKLVNKNFLHNKHLRKSVTFSFVVEILINITLFVGIILLSLFGIDCT